MDILSVLKDLAIIVVFAKVFGLIARKLKAPQVVGEIIAGLVVGPSVLGIVKLNQFLDICAGLGVVLLMFSAGLGTNLKQLLHTGVKALLIACAGVLVPLIGGTLLYMGFYGFSAIGTPQFFTAVFIGVIMTATSVSITVETLKELGKLKTELGTTILSAAIIDDVIGIMVLTFVIGFKNPDSNPGFVALSTLAFFALSVVLGFVIYKAFKIIDKRWPHTRRIPILALALCFGLSYVAEKVFGIADITGAYVAGIILSKLHDSDYIEQKMDINSYMIFGPIFFASIGLKTEISGFTWELLLFSLAFVAVALVSKIIGCGAMSRLCGFKGSDTLKVGVGMMTRGEVALIVAQRGLTEGMIGSQYFTSVILLIIVSSILTPIILKLLYARDEKKQAA
ncbi:MAG: cation:proton antiporter [Ruminococcus sp.]|nr:cation:proton antiporter [Ruminococcus sp.]MBQ1381664.1 cation:proton antiporter [Ruminococcus sp.]MBQ1638990.1 cation:proton antiporter [Ruminococcus sp.]MBQ1686260.1 cation:proton antiporter [Ruminococcus sp.]MBQ1806585.1 cation:proton antiporter [Ruminococcus sp.]